MANSNRQSALFFRYEDISPSTHNMDVPHVKREDYQLTDISDDGYLTLMTDGGDLREDLKMPDGELGGQLRSDFDAGKELLVSSSSNAWIPLSTPHVPLPVIAHQHLLILF